MSDPLTLLAEEVDALDADFERELGTNSHVNLGETPKANVASGQIDDGDVKINTGFEQEGSVFSHTPKHQHVAGDLNTKADSNRFDSVSSDVSESALLFDSQDRDKMKDYRRFARDNSILSDDSNLLARIDDEDSKTKDLFIVVDSPEKVVKTMESYVAFSVKTKTTRSDFENPEYCVKRRYSDFLWLRQHLEEKHPYLIIPPVPEKHSMTIDRFDKEFIRFRQVALHRFMDRLAQHPIMSVDESLMAFLTKTEADFQAYKKKGAGLLVRVSTSLHTIGGSFMLKNRTPEHAKLLDYAETFGDKMGALDRITQRLYTEQIDYAANMEEYEAKYRAWAEGDKKVADQLNSMAKLMETMHADYKSMIDQTTMKVILPLKEYALFSDSLKNSLARRDAVQHELEVVSEELLKVTEERDQLASGDTTSVGALIGKPSDESRQVKIAKLDTRKKELTEVQEQCQANLTKRNQLFGEEVERWNSAKRTEIKELIGGLADRNVDVYDKHIRVLEATLANLKECMAK